MTSSTESGLPVPPELQRSAHRDRQEWVDSGLFAVDLLGRTVGRDDLTGVDVLDVGCGTKIVKTLLDNDRAVGRYVGIDVAAPVIEWLRANVSDPRSSSITSRPVTTSTTHGARRSPSSISSRPT